MEVELTIVNGKMLGSIEKIEYDKNQDKWVDTDDRISSFDIELDMRILEDNLPERMEQAFNHLIELNGGSVVKEVF